MKTTTILTIAAGSLLLAAGSANAAATFNVNFDHSNQTRTDLIGPAGGSGETWAQTMVGTHGGTWSETNILDSAGNATAVDWTLTLDGLTTGAFYRQSPTADLSMLSGVLFVNNASTYALTISSLGIGDTYDLYIASGHTSFDSNTTFTSVNTTSTVGAQSAADTAPRNGSTWVQGENYVLFEDVVVNGAGIIEINYSRDTGSSYGFINGFQLVAVPEPSAVLLGALGALGLVARRRRN